MTSPAEYPEDSRGVALALAAWQHALAKGAGQKWAMLAALRAVADLTKAEIAEEMTVITAQTVLEATEAANARVAELEALLDDILPTYTGSMTPNACRSLVPASRLAGWRAVRHAGGGAVAAADELSRLGQEIQGGDEQ